MHWDTNRIYLQILTLTWQSRTSLSENKPEWLSLEQTRLSVFQIKNTNMIWSRNQRSVFSFFMRETLSICLLDQDLFANNYQLTYLLRLSDGRTQDSVDMDNVGLQEERDYGLNLHTHFNIQYSVISYVLWFKSKIWLLEDRWFIDIWFTDIYIKVAYKSVATVWTT